MKRHLLILKMKKWSRNWQMFWRLLSIHMIVSMFVQRAICHKHICPFHMKRFFWRGKWYQFMNHWILQRRVSWTILVDCIPNFWSLYLRLRRTFRLTMVNHFLCLYHHISSIALISCVFDNFQQKSLLHLWSMWFMSKLGWSNIK